MARNKALDIIEFEGGMNDHADARDIENNQVAMLKNLIATNKGVLKLGYSNSALDTNFYPHLTTGGDFGSLNNKNIYVYRTDFDASNNNAFTEYLLFTNRRKLYRLEYSSNSWSWVEILDLNFNAGGSLSPGLIVFDGNIRYSDGTFNLNTNSPYLPLNKTLFYGQVRRKYFTATENAVSTITGNASIIKPTDGKIVFNKNIETSSNNPTRGFLGTEVSEIPNKTLEDLTFGSSITRTISESSGTNHVFKDFQHEHSSIGLLTADVNNSKMVNLHGADQTEADINGQEDILAQFTTTSVVGGDSVTVYQIGNLFNASNYNYFFIDVNPDIVNSTYGNEAEFASNPNRSIKINGNFFQHNGSAWVSANWQWNDYNPTVHKVNDDGTIGAAVTVTEDEDQSDFLNLRFNDTSGTTRYRVGIRTNAGEIAEINNIELFATLGTISNDATDRKHLVMDVGVHSGGNGNAVNSHRLEFNNFFNLDYQSPDNLIEVTIAIPERIDILHSIDFIVSNIHTYSSSVPNTNIIHTLDSTWIAENQNKGWIKVAFKLDEQVNIENTPILGTLRDFIIRTNFTFNLFTGTSGEGLRPVSIDSVKQTTDNRGTWNGYYKFYYSWIYDEVQESGFHEFLNQGNGLYLKEKRLNLKNIIRELSTGGFGARGKRITGANLYWLEYDEERQENKFDDPFLLAQLDFQRGVTKLFNPEVKSWLLGTTATDHYTHNALQFIDPPSFITFSINSGYEYDPLNTIEELRFRTAVSLNRRIYYGNVDILWQKTSNETNYKYNRYGDRIYKSLPNKPDVILANNFLEVDVNDGDEITALESYADRLLVYKRTTMYIINATKELEYLEDTHKHKGVTSNQSIVKTDYGIAWANRNGCYLYNGERVIDLSKEKINNTSWGFYVGFNPVIGYEPMEKHLLISNKDTSGGFIYNINKEAFSLSTNFVTGDKSTNIVFYNNQIIQGAIDSDNNDKVSFKKLSIIQNAVATSEIEFKTKDFSFNEIGGKVNIKRIYLTYKGSTDANKSIVVQCFFNKSSSPITLTNGTLATSSTGFTTVELIPDPKSDGKSVFTMQLQILSNLAYTNFELHDISIIYQEKSLR